MKCDIVLNREQTVNAGNYSNVKPSVSVALKDVDVNEFDDTYQKLSNLVSCLLLYETKTSLEELDMVSTVSGQCKSYLSSLNEIDFEEEIKTCTKELKG